MQEVSFCRVMQNKNLSLKLMQRIFPELRLVAIKYHTIQKTGYGPIDSKGVRFDVYLEIDGRCFDVEMQMRQEGDERKQIRYYQRIFSGLGKWAGAGGLFLWRGWSRG